jgi:hypothetical protein
MANVANTAIESASCTLKDPRSPAASDHAACSDHAAPIECAALVERAAPVSASSSVAALKAIAAVTTRQGQAEYASITFGDNSGMLPGISGMFSGFWASSGNFARFLGTCGTSLAVFGILPARPWKTSRHTWA